MLRVCRRAIKRRKKKEKRSDQLPVYEIICSKSSLSNRFQSVGKLAPTFALRQPINLWDLFPLHSQTDGQSDDDDDYRQSRNRSQNGKPAIEELANRFKQSRE